MPYGEGTSGIKNASQVRSTWWIFIGTIPIDIPIAQVMMTSYSEEEMVPKTPKVKFVNSLALSNPTMVPRPLQIAEATLPRVLVKSMRTLLSGSHIQTDLTSKRSGSQVYSGLITRSRAKALTYAKMTLHSSVTILDQGKYQLEEQDEVISPAFYDPRTCLLYTSPSPRDGLLSRMPSSA